MTEPLPQLQRILAVDPGKARIGLAICDRDRKIASPLATVTRVDLARDLAKLKSIASEERVGLLLVGLPVHLDGHEGTQAALARQFGKQLADATGVAIHFWDERYTTVHAEALLWDAGLTHRRRKDRRDRVAAQLLLQSFLDAGCPAHEGLIGG